jgi:hypothetical protein
MLINPSTPIVNEEEKKKQWNGKLSSRAANFTMGGRVSARKK